MVMVFGSGRRFATFVSLSGLAWGCGGEDGRTENAEVTGTDATTASSEGGESAGDSGAETGATGSPEGDGDTGDESTGGTGDDGPPLLDVGAGETTGEGGDNCTVSPDGGIDAAPDCNDQAPAESFEPVIQWDFTPDDGFIHSSTIPLVGNLTDDNDDGVVDLCDTPDVVLTAWQDLAGSGWTARIYVLDGETGQLHYTIEDPIADSHTPAIGDIDGDGTMEIVTVRTSGTGAHLVAYDNEGAFMWQSAQTTSGNGLVSLADIDADGDVEIIKGTTVWDHEGNVVWNVNATSIYSTATTAADLDGDGLMEIIHPQMILRSDGGNYADLSGGGGSSFGDLAVADINVDGNPEVIVVRGPTLNIYDHLGSPLDVNVPVGVGLGGSSTPPAVHDIDGDDQPELLFALTSGGSGGVYVAAAPSGQTIWESPVLDSSGAASGTAFDFLGDSTAEGLYGDEGHLWGFDADGSVVLQRERKSPTQVEYPVVADVDDDGSAEILVVSGNIAAYGPNDDPGYPTLQVFKDAEERWVQARRIWNQHTYHVTNVREDGTIPQNEPKNWELLNTFRTNAQISADGGICNPPVD